MKCESCKKRPWTVRDLVLEDGMKKTGIYDGKQYLCGHCYQDRINTYLQWNPELRGTA